MKFPRIRRVAAVSVAVAAGLLVSTLPAQALPGDGEAYSLYLNVGVSVPPLPPVNLATITPVPLARTLPIGPEEANLPEVNVPGIVSTGALRNEARRDVATGAVRAYSELAGADLFPENTLPIPGFPQGASALKVGGVTSTCVADAAGVRGDAGIAEITFGPGVLPGGAPQIPVNPPPNTKLSPVDPLVQVILNEQIPHPDGSLEVNAIHVTVFGASIKLVDLILSHTKCGPAAPPIPLASGAGLWFGLGLLGAAAVPVGTTVVRRRRQFTATV